MHSTTKPISISIHGAAVEAQCVCVGMTLLLSLLLSLLR